jgi:uncharacterized repeat protein (TIGR02543 family)
MKRTFLLKTMLLLFALIVGSVSAWADTTNTITFADLGLTNGEQYSDPFDGGNFTVTFGGGGNDGKYYTTGSGIRVYGGGTMTIAAKSGNITEIVITWSGDSYKPSDTDVVNVGTYVVNSGTWTGDVSVVVFTRPSGSGHWRVQSIKVTTSGASTPSLSADNVNIGYDATNGSIAYTLNNEVTGGSISAEVTEGDWLTLGQGTSSPISFTCSVNPAFAERTATVTLTYTYNTNETATKEVTITQAGNPNAVNTISEINAVGSEYIVRGTVVATNSRGFVIGDGTGYVYYYKNAAPTQTVGDMVSISGTTGTYGQIIQFTSSATVTEATTSSYDNTPAATIITVVPDYSTGYHLSTYLQFEGELNKSNSNYFITLGEAQIQISYPTEAQGTALTALDGKTVRVKGYFSGINSSSKFTVMLESVEEIVIPAHTLTVYATGGSVEITGKTLENGACEVTQNTSVTAAATADEHYTFTSWTATGVTLANTTDNPITFTMPTNDVTLTANFTEDAKHNATFYVQGTLVYTDANVYEDEAISFPSSVDTPAGYTFMGWTETELPSAQATAPTDLKSSANMGDADVTYYAVFAKITGNEPAGWTETALADITSSDVFVFSDGEYAMSNDNGTLNAPSTVEINVSGNKITSEVPDNIKWNVSCNATDGYTFYPNGSATTWLYCTTTASSGSNNNIRVGTGNRKIWVFKDDYLKTNDTYTDRYLSIYNNNDFRGYVNTSNGAIKPKFYKYTAGSITATDYCTTVIPGPSDPVVEGETVTLTTTANMDGWRTFYDASQAYEVDDETKIYVATTATDSEIELTAMPNTKKIIPASTPVILKTRNSERTMVLTKTDKTDNLGYNILVATDGTSNADGYRLGYKADPGVAFFRYIATAPAAGIVYIPSTALSNAPEFLIISGETTGVNDVRSKTEVRGEYFNLAGQRVAQPTKGLYIVNGKKYAVR